MQEVSQVSVEEKFLFELQGFLLMREVLTPKECRNFLRVLEQLKEREYSDAWMEKLLPEKREYCNPTCDRRAEARVRFNGLLRLAPAFDALISHPKVMPYLQEFMDGPQLINS